MYILKNLIRICVYFSILVKLLSGYLLFAANFDDLQTIAKKFVAGSLSERFPRNNPPIQDSYYEYGNDYERSYEVKPKSSYNSDNKQPNNHKQISNSDARADKDTKIDFEELVERVKTRIEMELKNKYLNKNNEDDKNVDNVSEHSEIVNNKGNHHSKALNKSKKIDMSNRFDEASPDYGAEYIDEVTDKHVKYNSSNIYKEDNDEVKWEYDDAMYVTSSDKRNIDKNTNKGIDSPEIQKDNLDDGMTFKKIIMTNKDSYEDYKTPEKETNIYSSSEKIPTPEIGNKRFKIEKNKKRRIKTTEPMTRQTRSHTRRYKGKTKTRLKTTRNQQKAIDSDEFKTQETEHDETVILSKEKTRRAKLVTNMPTREKYITVTPNYNARLSTFVEKYDFDEPLPEKDREREILKYYGNPPARVNKKIRLMYHDYYYP